MDINATKNELEAKAYAKITVSPNNLSFKSTASSKTIKVTCSDSSWTVGGGNVGALLPKCLTRLLKYPSKQIQVIFGASV